MSSVWGPRPTAGDNGGEVNRPVFYDDSGVRVVAVQWTGRAGLSWPASPAWPSRPRLAHRCRCPDWSGSTPLRRCHNDPTPVGPRNSATPRNRARPRSVDETAGRVAAKQAPVIASQPTSPTEKVPEPDCAAVSRRPNGAGTNAEIVGSLHIDARHRERADTRPDSCRPTGGHSRHRGSPAGRHADRAKSNQTRALEHSARPSTHPASRAAAAKSKPGAQARTRSVKAAEAPARPSGSRRPATPSRDTRSLPAAAALGRSVQ